VLLLWAGLMAERLALDWVVAWVRPPARHAVPTMFVGTSEECRRVMGSPAFGGGPDHRSVGFIDVTDPPAAGALGSMREFPALLAASGAETVVACGYLSERYFHEVVDTALVGGCEVLSVPRAIEMAGVAPSVVWCQGQPLVQLTAPSFRGQQLVMKRVLDLAGALAGLLVFAPLGAVIALLIKLDSPGPVLFRQERVGRGGRLFRINKFRTMVDDAEARRDDLEAHSVYPDGRLFKIVRDPRTTRVGRLLRRTSLDELPQLLNVLRGEMSLVGPRPPLPAEVALYERHHYARFDATPGITGPWQVSGRSTMTDFNEIVRLETAYVRNWSMLSDFGILLRTIPAVFGMRGAH
jgi:exopolysaccharide biosynthesis polyprenyl glycosylphosphotransferase